ncbi:hypothetical protein SAMN05216203_0416 [Marinobacter daqiaonensis]|uniref:Extracellular solute-binding protein, family 3 n=1 Tax=Marinobacter daqiaonensis TaxID=650891 RepID=A0A1I6GS41_9GAMM|nr:amino acid ABC transporter substrate-binding protein [Marinobacter daqiaonensis]SFR44946.1 hypothetical protein SAMN05216203_0416 [Marinobacter daqiaonensis]
MKRTFSGSRCFRSRSPAHALVTALLIAPLLAFGAAADAPGEPTTYTLWYRNYDNPAVLSLLRIAFDQTPEYGAYRIQRSAEMVQGRALLELKREDDRPLSIINVATSPERERDLYEVPIPIDGGLLGFRVCVVQEEKVKLFAGVRSLKEFSDRGLTIGQGTHWPDTTILEANGIQVVTHTRFENLFDMLERGRFDCFARGVSEVLYDMERVQHHGLVVEPNLLLAYPMPSYFFLAKDDHETAQRLQLGMERAIANGTFGIFLAVFYGRAVTELNLGQRTMLKLENPYLSDDPDSLSRKLFETLRTRIERNSH